MRIVGTPEGQPTRLFWAGHWWGIEHIILNQTTTPERVASGEWVEFDLDEAPGYDPEVFCGRCAAGVESSEHHEKCVVTGLAEDGETA